MKSTNVWLQPEEVYYAKTTLLISSLNFWCRQKEDHPAEIYVDKKIYTFEKIWTLNLDFVECGLATHIPWMIDTLMKNLNPHVNPTYVYNQTLFENLENIYGNGQFEGKN